MRSIIVAALTVASLAMPPVHAEPGSEQVSVRTLPPATPYRVYVADFAINHIVDGRLHIVDGDTRKYLGVVATGFGGLPTLSPDRTELYVATTYYSRLSRGERADVVDIYDLGTLAHKGEIAIPPKHAQALPYHGTIRTSSDGRFLFVQNATPATSVSVVDLRSRTFVAEVPLPGCWIILPSQSVPGRFATLCGDGTLITVTLDEQGKPATLKRSARLFDPDRDPLFVHAENVGDRYTFVSFHGSVYAADVSGEVARIEPPWPLVTGADARRNWRPGGYQPLALHEASGRLFVALHPNGREGSHKEPAAEVWVFDLASHKRLARLPVSNATAIAVSRGERPRLFALDGLKMALATYDATGTPRLLGRMEGVGEAATLLELQ
jgi:methylamine dehydrogenase heavy chain